VICPYCYGTGRMLAARPDEVAPGFCPSCEGRGTAYCCEGREAPCDAFLPGWQDEGGGEVAIRDDDGDH
jgi:hypothetical protein